MTSADEACAPPSLLLYVLRKMIWHQPRMLLIFYAIGATAPLEYFLDTRLFKVLMFKAFVKKTVS